MSVIYLSIPMAMVLGTLFVAGFIWAVRSGQFDDVETPAHRILDENDIKKDL